MVIPRGGDTLCWRLGHIRSIRSFLLFIETHRATTTVLTLYSSILIFNFIGWIEICMVGLGSGWCSISILISRGGTWLWLGRRHVFRNPTPSGHRPPLRPPLSLRLHLRRLGLQPAGELVNPCGVASTSNVNSLDSPGDSPDSESTDHWSPSDGSEAKGEDIGEEYHPSDPDSNRSDSNKSKCR